MFEVEFTYLNGVVSQLWLLVSLLTKFNVGISLAKTQKPIPIITWKERHRWNAP